jgi:SAM-dependent methyltransferase
MVNHDAVSTSDYRMSDFAQPLRERPVLDGSRLRADEETIRHMARTYGPQLPIVLIVAQQAYAEWRLKLRGVCFRHRDNRSACSAYGAMTPEDFAAINARQAWANWRTIPRNLHQRLPRHPVCMVDLCCGIGQSTEVLAHYAAPGSRIIGLELNPQLIDVARHRFSREGAGGACWVEFHQQSGLNPFCDAQGNRMLDQSCDLVNASGAVACHFDHVATDILLRETARVLRPGGMALIDAGKQGTDAEALRNIAHRHGLVWANTASSCLFDRSKQLCFTAVPD